MQERTECDYEASKLPTDIHSTHGVGMNEPAKRGSKKIEIDGQEVFVPCGRLTEKKDFKSDLIYDEFIVYNVSFPPNMDFLNHIIIIDKPSLLALFG